MTSTDSTPTDETTDDKLYEFECPDCGFDHIENKALATKTQILCGICAGDSGHDVRINKWLPGENP